MNIIMLAHKFISWEGYLKICSCLPQTNFYEMFVFNGLLKAYKNFSLKKKKKNPKWKWTMEINFKPKTFKMRGRYIVGLIATTTKSKPTLPFLSSFLPSHYCIWSKILDLNSLGLETSKLPHDSFVDKRDLKTKV